MNTNRMAGIIARIVNRIAMENSRFSVFQVINMAKKDPDAELFVYDVVLTQKIYRQKYSTQGHQVMIGRIFTSNKNKVKELSEQKGSDYRVWDLYDKVVRGYWLPERDEMYFHQTTARGMFEDNYVCPDYEKVATVLSEFGVEPEKVLCII